MKRNATVSNSTSTDLAQRQHRTARYQKVYDGRKRRVRGLWVRNGRFYAQITVPDTDTGIKRVRRVPLPEATTVAQALVKLQDLLKNRRDNSLPVLRRTPKFVEYAEEYFRFYEQAKDAKRPATIRNERVSIRRWAEHLGDVRLDQITRAMINGFIAKRQGAGRSARTVNLEVIALRNVLKRSIDDGWLKHLPTENLHPLKLTPHKRELFSAGDIDRLCEAALNVSQNGQELTDYVRLMASCGARMSETLRLKWTDVDWERKQLTIGADGLTKNRQNRVVDFNAQLEAHLKEMAGRRAPDSEWLFPSPRRGENDKPATTLKQSLRLARKAADLPKFGFHDCRHYFISHCVMSGIDYMTIARWVGHQDGGVLIGKVYGHLSNEHAQRQAQRVVFGSAVISAVSVA